MSRGLLAAAALVACAVGVGGTATAGAPRHGRTRTAGTTLTLMVGGDVMLGRGVAALARSNPTDVLGGVEQLAAADITVANLESPLTTRPHDWDHGPNALEARPATARILRAAGFDALAIANNHAGDAGVGTVPDTVAALAAAGLPAIGGGTDEAVAFAPRVLARNGIRVAFLSFDDTGEGPHAGAARPGVAWWNAARARRAVARARAEADVVVVGLHGGSDYNPTTDPWLLHLGRLLASWGADVVWGTGPHVVQPVTTVPGLGGRTTVIATSLGNLLFDQHIPGTRDGALLEVLVGRGGARAWRVGTTRQEVSNAVDFGRWRLPRGDAVELGGDWWALAGAVRPVPVRRPATLRGFPGVVTDAALGDVQGTGGTQLAVAFWRPYRRTDVNALISRSRLVDRAGLTDHVGLYRWGDRAKQWTHEELWVAGTVLEPVLHLAACDGALAVAYSTLDRRTTVATGAWRWEGFGFTPTDDLPGTGIPRCAQVDGDGRLDPVILSRKR